jgi:peptidoglycan/LPS O-acetylase OafA/YrhL
MTIKDSASSVGAEEPGARERLLARTGRHRRASSLEQRGHDRDFRADIEGLRAVAVAFVVLYHAGVGGFGGGYVGVDVFFVISGFVITKLLFRQVERSGRPRFAEFYGRRARRILPAATLVAIITLFAVYKLLGFIRGNETASDVRWVAVFLGNFHFAAEGTNYFQSQLPPSPVQNYWSLAVEEQFYVIYPAAIFVLCLVARKLSLRTKVMAFTSVVFAASFAYSIYYTHANGVGAYFSIGTRAWELALGAFVAASTALCSKFSPIAASTIAWVGVAAIGVAASEFSGTTQYPGWVSILPVGGTALIIAGGVSAGRGGPGLVLGTSPFRWIGKLSFSIYLWHWPILEIATQDASKPLTLGHKLSLAAVSVAAAAVTYGLLENPIRNWNWLRTSPLRSIGIGLVLVAATFALATYELYIHSGL